MATKKADGPLEVVDWTRDPELQRIRQQALGLEAEATRLQGELATRRQRLADGPNVLLRIRAQVLKKVAPATALTEAEAAQHEAVEAIHNLEAERLIVDEQRAALPGVLAQAELTAKQRSRELFAQTYADQAAQLLGAYQAVIDLSTAMNTVRERDYRLHGRLLPLVFDVDGVRANRSTALTAAKTLGPRLQPLIDTLRDYLKLPPDRGVVDEEVLAHRAQAAAEQAPKQAYIARQMALSAEGAQRRA